MARRVALVIALLVAPAAALRLNAAKKIKPTQNGRSLRLNAEAEEMRTMVYDPDLRLQVKDSSTGNPLLNPKNWGGGFKQAAEGLEILMGKEKADKKLKTDKFLQDIANTDKIQNFFTDKHVVFIGDSVSHFQYMNLVYNVLHKKPPPMEFTEWKVVESDWNRARNIVLPARGQDPNTDIEVGQINNKEAWRVLYNVSNELFNDKTQAAKEVCDCWRDHGEPYMVQNRYFAMPKKNMAISFFTWQTDLTPLRGHWSPEMGYPIQTGCKAGSCEPPFKWENTKQSTGDGMLDLIQDHVMKMKPRPTHIVMNHGNWGHLSDEKLEKLYSTGKWLKENTKASPHFVWQTQTKRKFGEQNRPYFKEIHPDIPIYQPEENAQLIEKERQMAWSHGWEVFDLDKISEGLEGRLEDDYHYDEGVKTFFTGKFVQQFMM